MQKDFHQFNVADLWQKLIQGDEKAFEQLFECHYKPLLQFGLRLQFNLPLVKDCIQDLFLELWKKHKQLPEVQNHSAYLKQILKRKIFKHSTQKQRIIPPAKNIDLSTHSFETLLIQKQKDAETRQKLQKAFQQLSTRQKEIIELRFFQEMSYEEIAEQTSTQKRTIYNQMHSALKILKDYMLLPLFLLMQ